jgi:phage repressor protein C with HTH and peptisase S24 domain
MRNTARLSCLSGRGSLFEQSAKSNGSHKSSRRTFFFQVASDYMIPTFEPGDGAEIDTADAQPHRDGIYLMAFPNGQPALRRIQITMTGRARVFTDQRPEDYEEVDVGDLQIIGRATRKFSTCPL